MELKPDEFYRLQPYTFLQLYEGYLWRKDNEALFHSYFFLPIINYMLKKEYRHQNVLSFAKPMLSENKLREIQAHEAESRKNDEEYLRKKFNL